MKEVFVGIKAYDFPPDILSDNVLLREIHTLCRISYYMNKWYGGEGSRPQADIMNRHYGVLLCSGKLQPLINEARMRAEDGSALCLAFLHAADRVAFEPPRPERRFGEEENSYICYLPKEGRKREDRTDEELRACYAVIDSYQGSIDPETAVRVLPRSRVTMTIPGLTT